MIASLLTRILKRLRRSSPPVSVKPSGLDEDRDEVERERQEFARQLHDIRRGVHYAEVRAAVWRERQKQKS